MSDSIHANGPDRRQPKRKPSIGASTHTDHPAPAAKRRGFATQGESSISPSSVAHTSVSTIRSSSYVAGDSYEGKISHSAVGGTGNSIYMASGGAQLNIIHTSLGVPDSLKNETAHAAFHNSADRGDPPRCHKNTRLAILKKIMDWIRREDAATEDSFVMWMYGPAGSGKTAIAQSIAEQLHELGILLASYFFGRLDSSRNHSRSLIATIAYQIALYLPDKKVREQITVAVNQDPHVFNRSLEEQIKLLIALPLQPLIENGYFTKDKAARVIVIDGLDECVDRGQQVTILESLSSAIQKYQLPLLFFLSSRPELEIKDSFNTDSLKGLSTWLALTNDYRADSDIKIFLVDELAKIKQTHRFAKELPVEWPSKETISHLVEKSSGQFIYASTVVEFVKSRRHRPQERLDIILGLCEAQKEDLPFSELDTLYRRIFSNVKDWEKVSLVLAFLMLRADTSAYSQKTIEALLGLKYGDIRLLLCDLNSIIYLEGEEEEVFDEPFFYHLSVVDFLLDKSRSEQFHIDPQTAHARIAQKLLRFFQNCHPFELGGLDGPDLRLLSFHIERAADSKELEREIRNFHFLRLFEPKFPSDAVYSIPEYISTLDKSGPLLQRLPNEVNQQRGTFLTHIKKELKVYCQDPDLNFLLVCLHEGKDLLEITYQYEPRLRDTLRLQHTLQDYLYYRDNYFSEPTANHEKYKEILQDIIKDVILNKNYTSAALYLLQMMFPRAGQRLIPWPLSGTQNPWRLLGKADCSAELISYIQNLPWQLMITVAYFPFEDIDVAVQDYFARIDVPFYQDYASLALCALRKVSGLSGDGDYSPVVIKHCCYLLKKAGHFEELINCIQNLPWRFMIMKHLGSENLDISVQNYLVRMNIPSNQDHASLALHALRKVSEPFSNDVNARCKYNLLHNSLYLLEKAGRSEELIDYVQHFPLNHILGYEADIFARVDKATQAYLVRMNIVSDRDYALFALHGLGELSELLHQNVELSLDQELQLHHLSGNCVYMLEKAGPSSELIDLVQQLQSTWPKEDPPYFLPDTLKTAKKNLHDAFVAYLRRTAPHEASMATSQELETHVVRHRYL